MSITCTYGVGTVYISVHMDYMMHNDYVTPLFKGYSPSFFRLSSQKGGSTGLGKVDTGVPKRRV